MGELDWNESIKWAESYVNNAGNGGVLFLAIAAAIGMVFLVR